ncbi:MAG TPA: electron transfer flavoprotein subunit alpha/FixB family protein, partial [Terriglobales bacterium]|nr:electron transfer flavoprotein subunit alpha/FixB family protein [Terriglobales bacterium]
QLAGDLGVKLTAVLLGSGVEGLAGDLLSHGADRVILVDDEKLGVYMTEPYVYALSKVIENYKPEILLVGATAIGRDMAPRVSARVHTGLTADCTALDIDGETMNLLMTRPAFGGNIMATILCPNHRPQMATVRPGVMQKLPAGEAVGEIERFALEIPEECVNVEILEIIPNRPTRMNIQEAKVLVSGGRGIGGPEGFAPLDALAGKLGGTISSSRACVDSGWTTSDRQVGQTGSTVRPDLYFACGISGQIQHVAGMEESGYIIAINRDETAPIFGVADLGIVGDLHAVLPALAAEIDKVRAKQ